MIEVRDLVHEYSDGTVALDGVDLRVEDGEFVALVGSNGCGKTTLVRHFNALLEPTSGSVEVNGYEASENPTQARRDVGLVFQDADSGIVGETVENDVAFGPENLRLPKDEVEERVAEALETVGLEGYRSKHPHLLSEGEKRRLAVAGVLAMKPDVLVADEPFSDLDYPGVRSLLSRMVELNRDGVTLVVVTHDLEKVFDLVDRVVVLEDGEVADEG
ncbi:MAG: ABC transporter ATP-binding protein, partial [Halobacteria archaeon]|nr:ABC transporter ATP-binding protein [Halobacteria archaeon]